MKNKTTSLQQRLRQYQRQRFINLNHYLDKYASAGQYKILHKLRVEIKKITALIHVLEYCRQMPVSPLKLKHLDKIFHLAGKVRSYKIDKKLMDEFGGQSLPLHINKQAAKGAKGKLRNKRNKYKRRMHKLSGECMEQLPIINPQNLNAYLQRQMNFIDSFQSKPGAANLHELRKRIKEIIYLYPLRDASVSPKIKKIQVARLEQLQDAIGLWHDIDKFIKGVQTEGKPHHKLKIPSSLTSERKRRLVVAEKEISAGAGKKIA